MRDIPSVKHIEIRRTDPHLIRHQQPPLKVRPGNGRKWHSLSSLCHRLKHSVLHLVVIEGSRDRCTPCSRLPLAPHTLLVFAFEPGFITILIEFRMLAPFQVFPCKHTLLVFEFGTALGFGVERETPLMLEFGKTRKPWLSASGSRVWSRHSVLRLARPSLPRISLTRSAVRGAHLSLSSRSLSSRSLLSLSSLSHASRSCSFCTL